MQLSPKGNHKTKAHYLGVRRIAGMLPWKKPKGKRAYRRLKIRIGVPKELEDPPAQVFPDAKKDLRPSIIVGELSEIFSWHNPSEVGKCAT